MEEKQSGSDPAGFAKLSGAGSTGEENKKEKRREANRLSAKKARYREGVMIDELQRNCMDLGEQNAFLRSSNDTLRKAIEYLKVSRTGALRPALVRSHL